MAKKIKKVSPKKIKYVPVTKQAKKNARIAKRKKRAKKIKKFVKNVTRFAAIVLGIIYVVLPLLDDGPVEGLSGPYKVLWVTDGDTIAVKIDGEERSVRMIGVDTPESVHWDASKNVPEGKVASDYTKKLLSGKTVYLEYDVEREDKYGRTLAYVYLDDQKTMVEEKLLSDGMAQVMTIQPNSKYSLRFTLLQQEARLKRVGFWEEDVF